VQKIVKDFLEDLGDNVAEERVIDYVVKELKGNRRLKSIIEDPYVKNRLNDEQIKHLIENPQIIETVDNELKKAFKSKKFDFF